MSIIFAEVIFTQVMRSALFPTAYIDLVISMLLLLLLLLLLLMMMMMIMMITWVGALASVTSMLLMVWPSFGAMVSATIMFTHSGQFQISVGNLTIIGSDNGLSPGRRQAIIWTNVGILLIGPLGTNFNEMLTEIHTFSLKKIHLKMLSGKWRSFCLGLNVFTHWGRDEEDDIFQTTFSNRISCKKMHEFRLKFHLRLFPGVQLTISQHWSR